MIVLSKLQQEIMQEFYSLNPCKVIYAKSKRQKIWNKVKKGEGVDNLEEIRLRCPALAHQIEKNAGSGKNTQSAVYSECVYAQTLANMLGLNIFANCANPTDVIPGNVNELLKLHNIVPRYVYFNDERSRMLVQAGSCTGTDSALINVSDLKIYTIEFKEAAAKTSEPDLPKYGESGMIVVTEEFRIKYPQFGAMLDEKKTLNFFAQMGSNVGSFNEDSVKIAVTNNYENRPTDVVCTEDKKGLLTMMPSNQLSQWATIKGEIRPSGRNSYKVWTPNSLKKFLLEKGATIENNTVTIDRCALDLRKARGCNSYSGYKINPLFFVYKEDCKIVGNSASFNFDKIRQLNPTIAGKVFFEKLQYGEVKKYYFNDGQN